ncbi:MAG: sigma-70 family RNA polymerase sigma factor [Kofleriaceae bacterium]|nr:sigma-70 family RNA polymerase sigma factor [Kofleriaceae bacterium]
MDLDVYLPAIAGGDAAAFGRWMAGSETNVRGSLRSFAAVVDVEAVLQEALLRVWQVAPRFVPDGSANGLVRLAVRIARNLAIDEVRRIKARPVEPERLEAVADDVPAAPDPMLRTAIAECRDKLPAKPREAFDARLASAGSQDDEDLATSLNMRLNTFLQNFTRARKLLAECLGKRGIGIDQELGA